MAKKDNALILAGVGIAGLALAATVLSRKGVEPTSPTGGNNNNNSIPPPSNQDPLGVNITASPPSGQAPLSVSFQASPSGGIAPYNFVWFFGDGTTSNEQNPTHVYQTSSSYPVQCKVSDQQGKSFTSTLKVLILPQIGQITPPSGIGIVPIGNGTTTPQAAPDSVIKGQIVLSGSPLGPNGEILVGQPYHLEFFLTAGFGAVPPYTYDWNFGDSTSHGLGSTADHIWHQPGTITITLTITSSPTTVTEYGVTSTIKGTTSIIRDVKNVIAQKLQTGDITLIPKSTANDGLFNSDQGVPQEYITLNCNVKNNRPDRSITCYVQVRIIRGGSIGETITSSPFTIAPDDTFTPNKFIGQVTNDGQTQAVVTVLTNEILQGTEAFLAQVTQTV